MKQESVKSNFLFNVCYQVFILILPLITAPYLSRTLGAEKVGIYFYTQAFANYFVLLAMLGINNYGNREIARARDSKQKLSKVFWEIFSTQCFLTVFLTLVFTIYVISINPKNSTIYLIQIFYVISAGFDINWFCYGLEKFKITVTRSTIVRICTAIAIFVFVKSPDDLGIYTFIMAFGTLLGQLVVWPFVINHIYIIFPSIRGVLNHLKGILVLFIPVLAVSLYNIMDKLMLGWMSNTTEVGFYTYAEKIVQIPIAIVSALGTVLMPKISNLVANGNDRRSEELMDKSMLVAMLSSVAFSFGLAAIADVFAPWFYGVEFTRCGLFIVLLCPIIIFKSWSAIIRTQYIIPAKKDKILMISVSIGAAVNIIANLTLIPHFQGIGAIIGTFFAELVVFVIQLVKVRKNIKLSIYLKDGMQFCLIGALMYIGIDWIESLNMPTIITLVFQVSLGALIYVFLSCYYMLKVKKEPFVVNSLFKTFKIKKTF